MVLQQAVGKPARARPEIGADPVRNRNLKVFQRPLKLGAGPAHEGEFPQDSDRRPRIDQGTGFLDLLFVDKNLPGQKQRLRLLAAFNQASLHQHQVHPLRFRIADCGLRIADCRLPIVDFGFRIHKR